MITPSHTPPTGTTTPPPGVPASAEEALAWAGGGGEAVSEWREWPAEVLVPSVRVACLGAEIRHDPGALRGEERDEALYQAVRGTPIGSVPRARVRDLVGELTGAADAVLQGEALRLAREGLHAGVLAPRFVRAVLTGLLGSGTPAVVNGALDELAEPWAALEPLPVGALSGLLARATAPVTADAVLATAACHGHGELLRRAAEDRELAPRVRRRALELLGETAERTDVPAVLALAAEDPLLLGGPAVACLRAMHRRGHFVTDPDVPAVLALALADHTIPARTVATILYTSRHELLRALLDAAPAAPDWPRRLDLLTALAAQGVDELPIASEIARVLPLAETPTPFLHALRTLRAPETEPAVLAALPRCPAAALDALEAVGGDRTVRSLARGLGIDGLDGDEPSAAAGDPLDPDVVGIPWSERGGPQGGPSWGRCPTSGADTGERPGVAPGAGDSQDGRAASGRLRSAAAGEAGTARSAPDAGRGAGGDPARGRTTDGAGEAEPAGIAPGERHRAESRPAPGRALVAEAGGAGPGGIVPALRAVRRQALEVLWLLTTDPELRHRILVRLDPVGLPARVAADLGGPDEGELAVLASHLDPDRPADALCRLAAHGGAATLPVLADLLLRLTGDLAAYGEPEGSGATTGAVPPEAADALDDLGRRLPARHSEPAVPPEVVDALAGLGRRLHARGRIRPACLLDATDEQSAGHALVADLALDLLDRPGLSAGEQAVLLKLVRDLPHAPHARVRSRVHRLLRHPDRHVRKHVVALLARDTAGDGVEALSAGLLTLTGPTRDPQTVRQTLAALGRAEARWASDAIAGCLGHPNMNVRKTAAEALATAGTPRAVPPLLHRLGRDDNPGLRALVVRALRSLLGEAYAATVTAAAEGEGDARIRDRLRVALDTTPTPRDADVEQLAEHGWDQEIALRVAERLVERGPAIVNDREPHLRPYLVDWLALAGTSADARRTVLSLLPDICPGPWERHELAGFARAVPVFLDALGEEDGEGRDRLIGLLEAAAPLLRPAVAADVVTAVRALPPRPAGRRSTLPLLRRCGAVVVRTDLDRELACAGLAENPDAARTRLLREEFGLGESQPYEEAGWHAELTTAARSMESLAAFRSRTARLAQAVPRSRAQLAALVDAQADVSPAVRGALVDWMTELQPLGEPAWTLGEQARTAASASRAAQDGDLDQPRSAAQRERLYEMLASATPDRRDTAARTLLTWPEPAPRAAVLDAYLRGRVEVPSRDLHRALTEAAPGLMREAPPADGPRAERLARIAVSLGARDAEELLPLLLRLWEHGPADTRPDFAQALRNVPSDSLAARLEGRIAAGTLGLLPLLAGRPLLRTPTLALLDEQYPDARLVLVDGPLRGPGAPDEDADALRALRERTRSAPPQPPSREELYRLARSGDPERIRRALTRLSEDADGAPHPELADLLRGLLTHPSTGVRLHAHRTSRALLDRDTHLRLTEVLLDDPQPDVVRSAVRVLAQARWQPATPALTSLLDHAHPTVRRAAEDGLVLVGPAAVPALRRAVSRARPDRRARYADVLARVTTAAEDT
ncbi:HEAT repeat domain-containing protein [Streptomyces solicathayae]|uniref:HEAT repeat domain-containing protein n=1 Tax=Streptomyces solicathayae TaxID=3081768 RepID=A0ABZ0M274_9ACTN|nr:HEAT repeat domain-containing protein [Streptomyces sp. HUAS YS2]WOX25886.1 HEAT repeat domain-containing protein [Streptomyces sp. HUAS YS2]